MPFVYKITANGKYMGEYLGADIDEALDSYAVSAGYKSFVDLADALEQTPSEALACIDWDDCLTTEERARANRGRVGTALRNLAFSPSVCAILMDVAASWEDDERHTPRPEWNASEIDAHAVLLDLLMGEKAGIR